MRNAAATAVPPAVMATHFWRHALWCRRRAIASAAADPD
jgi:hypothetical protein